MNRNKHNMTAEERQLVEALGHMPRERQPGRDLWPDIERGLATAPQAKAAEGAGRGPRLALVAALVMALGVGYMLGLNRGQPVPGPAGESLLVGDFERLTQQELRAPVLDGVSREYQAALREVSLGGRGLDTMLGQRSEQEIRATLAELRTTAAQLRGRLKAQPNNTELASWLVRVEARELGLLRQLHDFTNLYPTLDDAQDNSGRLL